jgi:hypothetical protein
MVGVKRTLAKNKNGNCKDYGDNGVEAGMLRRKGPLTLATDKQTVAVGCLTYRAFSAYLTLGRSHGRPFFLAGQTQTLTETLGPLTRASEGQTMPVDARRGASELHVVTLRPPCCDGLIFLTSGDPRTVTLSTERSSFVRAEIPCPFSE